MLRANILKLLSSLLMALVLLFVNGCGQSGDEDEEGNSEPVLERIVIDNQGLMFTSLSETASLQARAFNSNGEEVRVDLSWSSSHPDQVHIDSASGVVTSISNGSAVLIASADGVDSNPVTAVVTEFQAGVRAFADDEVLSEPEQIVTGNDPGVYEVGLQYTILLAGSINQPQPGEILAANGEIPFAGRVISVQTDTDGNYLTTLEIIAVNELFANFNMDEVIDLANAPVTVNPQLDEYFVVEQRANGEIALTPRQESLRSYAVPETDDGLAAKPIGTFANPYHPFECSYSPSTVGEAFPIKLELGNSTITLKQDLSLPFLYDETRGLEKLALRGEISLSRKVKFAVTAAFEAKITCKLKVGQIDIPLPGALGFLVGVQVPIGIGGELAAKIKVADVGIEPQVEIKATAEAGYYNPPICDTTPEPDPGPGDGPTDGPTDGPPITDRAVRLASKTDVCGFDISFNVDADFKANLDRPTTGGSLATLANDVTLEPKAGVFGYAVLAFGNKYFSALSIQFLELQVGPYLSANLATANGQIVNDGYKSDYKLGGQGVLKPGKTIADAMQLFGGVITAKKVEVKLDQPWSTSPKAKSVTLQLTNSNYLQGDVLEFNIELDETTVDPFPVPGLFYNVADILIFKKAPEGSGEAAELITSTPADDGQLTFTLNWTADANGNAADQFFAFVSTKLLPSQQIGLLELDKVKLVTGEQTGKIFYQVGSSSAFVESYDFTSGKTFQESSVETTWARHPAVLPGQNILAYTGRVAKFGNLVNGIYMQTGIGSIPSLIALDGWAFSISGGSSKIVYEVADTLYMANYDGSEKQAITSDNEVNDFPAISPDGTLLAYAAFNDIGDQSHIELMDLSTLSVIGNISKNAAGATYNPAWSPDSKFVAYELDNTIQIAEIATGNISQLNTTTSYNSAPSWSPDGKKIAFGYDGDIYTVNLDGSERTNITQTPDRAERNPAWSN